MFHFVWPAKEKHHTLAAIGFIMIIGPHAPALELQARWAVQVFKKNVGLPPREVMMKEITGRKMGTFKRFGKHKIQVGTTSVYPRTGADLVFGLQKGQDSENRNFKGGTSRE